MDTTQQRYYAQEIQHLGIDTLKHALEKAERREVRTGGTDKAWVVDALRAEIERRERRGALTDAFKAKMHRLWHEVRQLPVCDRLACEHPWLPR